MSIGDLPSPQQQYDAMMTSANAFLANADSMNLNGVIRQSDDCIKLMALAQAAMNLYNTYCDI
jgi:hypothetical protein